ncbi:MAG: hypothetical protein C5B44_01815 [Acidobacteria bacterium]|nr:MAG: hypothetical protein C5B44_01815 [Acidobacteriota bacterium]
MKKCPKCGNEYPDATTLCPFDGVALETTGDALIGQTLAGKYRIDEKISEGGMGSVYRGTHMLMEKTVAVKVLRPSLAADEKIVARFSREARAASRISHPHALSVTDFGEDEGRVFLVMEYLQGRTLKEIFRSEGPMTLSRVVDIVKQVGGALDAAHAQGVVHRDLKSDNIMLLSSVSGDYAKVLDFGIAKINEPEDGYDVDLTAPNLVIGTPQYMSPEQCSHSGKIDARSDIYSLGIIVYEMLVGHVPFTAESPTAIMLKQMQDAPPSVLTERADLPMGVAHVIARALSKRPEDRYQRAGDMVEDLSIASSLGVAAVTPIPSPGSAARDRVISDEDDLDEETVVHPRIEPERAPITVRIPAATASVTSFNPWKVLIASGVALLVIFTVIYAFTRNSQTPPENQSGSSLVADPNSKPVEPAQPATGKGEEGLPAGGAVASPPANVNANANANANANVNPAFLPSPVESVSAEENVNANSNVNSNRKAPSVPSPTRSLNVNEPPAPPPSPQSTRTPAPQASPTESPRL